MGRGGYTKYWRRRWDQGYHRDQYLWIMMDYFIDFANWEDAQVPFIHKGKLVKMVKIKRGQHMFTVKGLADFFGESRNRTRGRLKKLQEIEFLNIQSDTNYSIATIINYEKYQSKENIEPHSIRTPIRTAIGHQSGQQSDTPNKNKEEKEEKEEEIVPLNPQQIINQCVGYLNHRAEVNFKPDIYATQTLIIDRINEGYVLDDFKAVIAKKCDQWLNDAKMVGNLRPATLFANDKFEGYLQEARRNGSKPKAVRKPQGIELLGLGFDVLTKFGEDKFREFCVLNKLQANDVESIRRRTGGR